MRSTSGRNDGRIGKILGGLLSTPLLCIFLVGCGGGAVGIREGDKAPDFALPSQDGKIVQLSDFHGRQNVVLYFYPKDDTPGCTKEACSFRDDLPRFRESETEVLGVSVDDVESHKEFQNKHKLNFTLLADPDKHVTKMYGVKTWYGLADRVTFIIDKEGIVRKVFPDVDVSRHSEEVLAVVRTLSGGAQEVRG